MLSSKLFRNVILLFFSAGFLWIFFIFGKRVKQKWIVYKTLESKHWQERNKEIANIKPGRFKIIFLGNSLTELFDLEYYFKDSTFLNCGIVGDFTEGLVKRSHNIARLKPEKLFIEIGINDMIEQISLGEINKYYRQLIEIIQKETPATKIYIESNLPVIINRPSLFTGDKKVNELITRQNSDLRLLADKYHCVYINIYPEFRKEKDFEGIFTWDGIHFTQKGYEIWKRALLPYLSPSESDK